MKYTNKTFSVGYGSKEYRSNWEKIFQSNEECLTSYQVSLMKHATAWSYGFRLGRNYFAATLDSSDYKQWKMLVEDGYAFEGSAPRTPGELIIFHVSEKGIKYLEQTEQG